MKTKNRIRKPLGAPASEINITQVLASLNCYANAERSLVVQMDEELNAVRARYDQPNALIAHYHESRGLLKIREAIADLTLKAQTWAEAHPERFTKKKSIQFTDATIGFRKGTPKVELLSRKWTWKTALEAVKEKLYEFIRHVPEIDKEAILTDYAAGATNDAELATAGLKISRGETFYVEPHLTELDTRTTAPSPATT
jgi:phage host-nuclease inhibitor protein Gam